MGQLKYKDIPVAWNTVKKIVACLAKFLVLKRIVLPMKVKPLVN